MQERERGFPMEMGNASNYIENFRLLSALIEEEKQKDKAKGQEKPYSSPEVSELYTALAKAQGEFKPVAFNRVNPYLGLQYVDLCNLMRATRTALTKYGLAVTQFIQTPDDGSTVLHTRLLHSSGQWMETRARLLPVKNDVAAYESTLNAQKRFSYMALLGIVPVDDPGDDDGEMAMVKSNEYIARGPAENQNPKKQSMDVVSKHELEELERELKDYPELAENLLEKLMLQSLADLPSSQYRTTIIRIRKIKEELNNRDGRVASKL